MMEIQGDSERQYSVLVVEDDLVDVELVRRQLGQILRPRFRVENAPYLKDALDMLAQDSFDVVLLDLNLPDSCSLESVHEVKSAWSSGPVIVLTGLDEECLGIDAIRHGAEDYLGKDGLSAALLSRAITYAVERHRMAYWLKATGESKDDYLADVCEKLREGLSELLLATSDLVGSDESLDPGELEQVNKIMSCGKRMSQLINDATPVSTP